MSADQIPAPPDGVVARELELLAERDARLSAEVRAQEAAQRADRLGADLAAVVAELGAKAATAEELDHERSRLRGELASVYASRWWRLASAYRSGVRRLSDRRR